MVRSGHLITLIKCLNGHKSLEPLCNVKIKMSFTHSVSESPIELFWTAKKKEGSKKFTHFCYSFLCVSSKMTQMDRDFGVKIQIEIV